MSFKHSIKDDTKRLTYTLIAGVTVSDGGNSWLAQIFLSLPNWYGSMQLKGTYLAGEFYIVDLQDSI